MLVGGNDKSMNDVKINVSRDPLETKLKYFLGVWKPQVKLLGNLIFYLKTVGAQVLKIFPDLKSVYFLIYLNSVGLSV